MMNMWMDMLQARLNLLVEQNGRRYEGMDVLNESIDRLFELQDEFVRRYRNLPRSVGRRLDALLHEAGGY